MVRCCELFPGGARAVEFVRDSENLGGWYYRNVLLNWAPVEDSGFKSRLIYDIYTSQEEKGYWNYQWESGKPAGKSPDVLHATATGRQLVRLARLGVARHERHIKKALSWLLERNIDYGDFARRNEAWGGDWVALEAAFLWGREDDKTVQAGVRSIVQNEDRWLGDGRNRHAHALRILLLDRTKCDGPAAGRALRWLVKNQRADGTWPSNSLYECLDTLIRAPRSVGAALVEKALPKLQKTQKRGGSWKFPQRGIAPQTPDEQHVRVLECLVRFGFLEIP